MLEPPRALALNPPLDPAVPQAARPPTAEQLVADPPSPAVAMPRVAPGVPPAPAVEPTRTPLVALPVSPETASAEALAPVLAVLRAVPAELAIPVSPEGPE